MLGDGNPYIDNTQNDAFELAQCYTEALKDSRSLQALADDLLDTLIRTQRELAEANLHAPIPSSSNQIDTLCNLGNLILSLQNIQRDVAINIESFSMPPKKTFFQSNIEQLTTIYQLLFILPSLHPFIPDKSSNDLTLDERMECFVNGQGGEELKREEAACFTREPRSMSALPLALARQPPVEVGETWH